VVYEICVRHRRPTPVGESFVTRTELGEVAGRKLLFASRRTTGASSSARARYAAPSSAKATSVFS
jgi:predicted thioesterase